MEDIIIVPKEYKEVKAEARKAREITASDYPVARKPKPASIKKCDRCKTEYDSFSADSCPRCTSRAMEEVQRDERT